ncbi:AAA family ATPase ['Camptotheca acuminata' phytoplasma]|uniref:AAA family ATPase n=1 Tax='Camptotheca acuminata' phytoplasma TaxID=3239192 RepID=UPI00351A1AF8
MIKAQEENSFDRFPIIKKLKQIFPKLNNNPELFNKVLTEILKEFDKPHYRNEIKTNINERIELLEKYNIKDEFSDVISQTVYDENDIVLVFIGNLTDFSNYNFYLEHKKNNFNSSKGMYWKNWSPANIETVSKTKINFLIDVFEEIIILEKDLVNQKNKNIYLENIKQLQDKILNYETLFQKQDKFLQDKDKDIERLNLYISRNQEEIAFLNLKIQENTKILNQKQTEIADINSLSQIDKQKLQTIINKLNQNNLQLLQKLEEKEAFINDKQEEIQELILNLRFKNQEIISIHKLTQKEKQKFELIINEKIGQIRDIEKILQNSKNKIDELNQNIESYQKKIQKQQEKMNFLEQNVLDNKEEINSLKQQIQYKNEELISKKLEIENKHFLNEELRTQFNYEIQKLEKEIENIQNKLNRQEIILFQNKEDVSDLIVELKTKNEQITKIQNINQQEQNILKEDIANKIIKLNQLEEILAVNQKDIENYQKTFERQKKVISQQQATIDEINVNIEIKEKIIFSLKNKIDLFVLKIEEKNRELIENKFLSDTEKHNLNTNIDFLQSQIKIFRKQIEEKENFLQEYQKEISFLNQKLKEKKEEIVSFRIFSEKEKNKLKKDIDDKIKQLKETEDKVYVLRDKIDQLNQDIEQQRNIILQKKRQIVDLEKNIEDNKIEIFALNQEITKKEEQLKQKTAELLEKEELSQKQKDSLNQEINELNRNIVSLKEEIFSKNKNLETLEQQNTELRIDFQKQEEKIKKNQVLNENDKQELKTEIKKILKNLEENQTKIEKYKQKIENSIQDNTLFTNLILKTMQHIGNMHKETLNFMQEIKKDQEIKKNNESDYVQSFLKKTDKFASFAEVIGMEDAKEQLRESLEHLKNLDLYKNMGTRKTPKGILLYGPPGTGKTYLAEAFAKEAGLPFFCVTSDDFSKTYVGEAPRLIKKLFEEARRHSPSVILIDECEVAFRKRNSDGLNSDHGNVITAFLSQIEGVHTEDTKPVFVIGTTNFKDEIDSSILSRFNKLIKVDFWSQESLNVFVKKISKKYKLDMRAYKYLDQIVQKIIDSKLDFLRTPRKIIELFEQASITALLRHQHLNILPIDLEFIFSRFLNDKEVIDWDDHQHVKHQLEEILSITDFKNTPIKHIFKDSHFIGKEEEYLEFLKQKNEQNKKIFYLEGNSNELTEIEIKKDELQKIQKFYSEENPLPEKLLGFYFEPKKGSNSSKKTKKISSLEDVLNEAIFQKSQKIYFFWDIEKNKYNQDIMKQLLEKYHDKYNFLKLDPVFQNQLPQIYKKIENNKIEMEHEIEKYIQDLEKRLFNDVYHVLIEENNFINLDNIAEIKSDIKEHIKELLEQGNASEEEIKNQIIFKMQQKFSQEKNLFLQQKINDLIKKIPFNKEIFSDPEIQKIQQKINDEMNQNLIKFSQYSLKNIENYINKIKSKHDDKIFRKKWKMILPQVNIVFNLDKNNIIEFLKNKTQKELFYQNLTLEKIIDVLNKEADTKQKEMEQQLNKKVSEDINKYIFIDNMLGSNILMRDIELINRGALSIVESELKKDQITKTEIDNKVYSFVKNYKIQKEENSSDNNSIFAIIKNNFYWFKYILFLILIKYFFFKKSQINKKKK